MTVKEFYNLAEAFGVTRQTLNNAGVTRHSEHGEILAVLDARIALMVERIDNLVSTLAVAKVAREEFVGGDNADIQG